MAESSDSVVDASAGSLPKNPNGRMGGFDAPRQPSHLRSSLKIADLINDSNEPVRGRGRDAIQTAETAASRAIWPSQQTREVETNDGGGFHQHHSYSHAESFTESSSNVSSRLPPTRPRSTGTNETTLFSGLTAPTALHQTRKSVSRRSSVSTQSTSSSFARSYGRECSKSLSPQTARERRESRPAYQVEEDTFIWYHRDDLGMQWNDVSKAYNAQFPNRPRIGRQGIQSRYYRVLEVEGVPKIRKRPKSLKSKRIRHHYGVIAKTNRRYPWMQGVEGPWGEQHPDLNRTVSRPLDFLVAPRP